MRSLIRYTHPRGSLLPAFGFSSPVPWTGLENDIDRWFESTLSDFLSPALENRFPVDLYEDKDHTYVRADLPGVDRQDINVEMVNGYLTIGATRKAKGPEGGESFALSRSVAIPEDVHADKVSAAYENGVLTVTLPKKEEAKPRKVTVEVK
ncbi:MAG TPA: Hsp20/alpha crystallin family protein [Opitutaceae bacterium]|nr:Hsp20/alpha crystallin family protein [Opitutaceae bacterium]